ncbi:GAF domain-containing protein [Reinekea marina]|uniref:GAF domain-containing protein n=1 Tax=Reinekea marina TaxID=1310421 RepID=A0ABV7WMW7_9GAMM|nr:GAF domain-containing protein [Reinekea marina]MDN3648377.1 GAF domain-containing protein [Reinekea marina]
MAEQLTTQAGLNKAQQYAELIPQLKALTESESNTVANLANISAALRQTFGFFWVGFYLVDGDSLVLGPFQGDIACTRIAPGRGVCGTAWQTHQTQWVPDVDAFPGHIACSSLSRSEVVVPIIKNGTVLAVLDVDSEKLDDFEQADVDGLEQIALLVAQLM